ENVYIDSGSIDYAKIKMSIAKPLLDYARSLKPKKGFTQSFSAFKRLMNYHKRYYWFIAAIVVLAVIRSILFSLEPLYTSKIIIDVIGPPSNTSLLWGYLLVIVSAGIGYAISNFVLTFVHGVMSQYIVRDVRTDYYRALQRKSFSFYDSMGVGDLTSRATVDLQMVDSFLRTWLGTVLNAILTTIIIIVIIWPISPIMTLISLATMPLIFYFTTRLWLETMPLFRNMQLILGRLSSYIQQNIVGMKTVRIFRREKDMVDGFKDVESVYVDTAITAGKLQSIYMPLGPAILTLGIALVYVYAGETLGIPGSALAVVQVGDIILFARYMMRLTFPIRDLSQTLGSWITAYAGLERVLEMTDAPRNVEDLAGAKDVKIEKGKLELENVTFGYVKDRPVLNHVTFIVQPGEKIAILGATGSGKSSLIYLVPRFYDIQEGSIKIDGTDIRQFKLDSLRRQIGVVLQDVFLFTGTIKENIAFGKPDASMEQIVEAAKAARIHDFIESLPTGYDTLVGERGVTLSGGQKQRITIARALITNPKILIMDDSLSFVDAKTEQEIQSAIEEATKMRTTLIIAQRFSTIKTAEKILVLENGSVAEFGTHEELMASNGVYKKVYETQFIQKASPILEETGGS
ncbi:MAG TPA: ABC transporter ATP-binding protein, partial [Candidatus Eisenbacteria bacterium]|nr:ABC transporter ATP-binding protein [Candidatus Eisenbacteria bacterium]